MPVRILVLHGPNLNLLEKERSLETIDARLKARAKLLGIEVRTVQANGESGLLDFIGAQRHWFDAAIVNPAVLQTSAVGLAEAFALLGKPVVEVMLDGPRGPSALANVAKRQFYGLGADGYLQALDLLAPEGSLKQAEAWKERQQSNASAAPSEPEASSLSTPRPQVNEGPRFVSSRGQYPERKPKHKRNRDSGRAPEAPPEPSAKTIGPGDGPRFPSSRPQARKTIGNDAREAPPAPAPVSSDAPRFKSSRHTAAEPARVEKTIGRPGSGAESDDEADAGSNSTGGGSGNAAVIPLRPKTIGRGSPTAPPSNNLTRAVVRAKIADRLAGKLSPATMSTWARSQWQELQRGAPCEAGQRERLEDVLQTLLLSATSKTSDSALLELMTQLD